jgi:hypothetical protein
MSGEICSLYFKLALIAASSEGDKLSMVVWWKE